MVRPHLMLLPLLIGVMSCGDRQVKSGVENPYPASFRAIRKTILMPRCGKCHALVESRKLLLQGWVVPGDAGRSALFYEVDGGSMPPYGHKLLDEEISAIRQWIDAGAPND